ncbi:MAG: ABC transporter substrate-binding protein [Firmicutes bacterium]|nr:ABC transporter substrate-binding protein [Bacillota bacterium]
MLCFCLVVFCCLLALSGCANNGADNGADSDAATGDLTPVTLMLDWTPNTNHTGVYVAMAKGYYQDAGLEVNILQPAEGGTEMAVATGQAEFGVSFQEVLVNALASDDPLPITAVAAMVDHNTSTLISLKEKNITSFKNLENATYAAWGALAELAVVKQCMEIQGGDFDTVNVVPAPGVDAIGLLQGGDVDAVWVYEAWEVPMFELAGIECNTIRFRDVAPELDYYTPLLIAGNAFLEENPEAAKAFLAATAKGYQFAAENPEEAADILCEAAPELNQELVLKSQNILSPLYQDDAPYWGYIDQARWQTFNDWFYNQGLIEKEVGAEGYTNDYLPQ